MSVHSLLVTVENEEQLPMINLALCPYCNFIDNRGLTFRYTVFSDDLPKAIETCRKNNVTAQEILERQSPAAYPVLNQGAAKPWTPKVTLKCSRPALYQGATINCDLNRWHKGPHEGNAPDGKRMKWRYGRHQTQEFIT